MAQPINIEDLQNRRKVKAYKIGFKKDRTPADIYHNICTFANDFDNLRGILLWRRNVPTLFFYIQEKLGNHLNYVFKETDFLRVFLEFLNKEEETEDINDVHE